MARRTDLIWIGHYPNPKKKSKTYQFSAYLSTDLLIMWKDVEHDNTFRNLVSKLKQKFVLKRIYSIEAFRKAIGTNVQEGFAYYQVIKIK